MSQLHPHTRQFHSALNTLAFADVLEMAARNCVGAGARARIRTLTPMVDRDQITRRQRLLEELRDFTETKGSLPVTDTEYRSAVEALADKPGILDPEHLLNIRAGEAAIAELTRLIARHREAYPLLTEQVATAAPNLELVQAISDAIENDGEIKDTASPELRAARKAIQSLRGQLRDRTEKMASSFGEGSHTTVIGNRYVLLAPRTKFRKDDGLVHGSSQTGGSVYFEPFGVVALNNDLEEASSRARAEEARILADLSRRVAENSDQLLANADVMESVDMARAVSQFCTRFRCVTPGISRGRIRLAQARHPLLEASLVDAGNASDLVPTDLILDVNERVMIITGPNAGGKTVTLKTLGTAVMLNQCGFQIPAAPGSELPIFHKVFVDIGDGQSIASSLSSFTSHLQQLNEMVHEANQDTLVLVDEIGDGTDPDEGAALAMAVVDRLRTVNAAVVVTTHFGKVKTYALKTDGVANASMAFAEDDNRPLYKLLQGIAGRSRGLETARRVGFDPDTVSLAESYLDEGAFQMEALLSDLESSHIALERERESLTEQSGALRELMSTYEDKRKQYDVRKKELDRKALREAEQLVIETRRELEDTVKAIKQSQARRDVLQESRTKLEGMLRDVQREQRQKSATPPLSSVSEGQRVRLNPKSQESGVVVKVKGDSATVEIGGKRITLRAEMLYPASEPKPAPQAGATPFRVEPLLSTTLDIRGFSREDAIDAIDQFMDQAVVHAVEEVKIIHGIGTGVLSRTVREVLSRDHRVTGVRNGEQIEGGLGVTIVTLAS